jgi:hypothetical protein
MEQIEDPAFTIRIDAARKYVEIGMLGLWDDVIAKRFERELRCLLPALPKGGCRIGEQNTLFDSTAYLVQSQDVTARLAGMAADPSIGSRGDELAVRAGRLTARHYSRWITEGLDELAARAVGKRSMSEPTAQHGRLRQWRKSALACHGIAGMAAGLAAVSPGKA